MALPKSPTPIETTTVAAADLNLVDALGRVRRHEARIVVADSDGEPAGAIVSLADLRTVQQLEARKKEAQALRSRLTGRFADCTEDELEADILAEIEAVELERRQR